MQTWAAGAGASLYLPEMKAPAEGHVLSAPVMLEIRPGHQVAGLQFDLEYDPSVFELESEAGVQPGIAATEAEKQVTYSPLGPGKIRVIVFGLNQTLLSDGEVASVRFVLNRLRARPMEQIKVSNAILADLSGTRVREDSRDGLVQFSSDNPSAGLDRDAESVFPVGLVASVVVLLVLTAAVIFWRSRSRPRTSR